MKRYYVCRVVGDGTENNPYRPKVANYPVNWVGILGSNPDGTPKKAWALVLVNAVDHTALLADNQIKAIPDLSLDATWGTLSTPQRNAAKNAIEAEGIDLSWVNNQTTIRKILRYLGQEQESGFNENKFDVAG